MGVRSSILLDQDEVEMRETSVREEMSLFKSDSREDLKCHDIGIVGGFVVSTGYLGC